MQKRYSDERPPCYSVNQSSKHFVMLLHSFLLFVSKAIISLVLLFVTCVHLNFYVH